MITDIFLFLINALLQLILILLTPLVILIPPQIGEAFTSAFSYIHILDSFFPVSDGIQATLFVISVWVLFYTVKVFLFGWSVLPFIGKNANLPTMTQTDSVSYGSDGHTTSSRHIVSRKRRA